MFIQIDPMIEIFDYVSNGSPYGVAMIFLYLYLQEKKFSRELTQKTMELLSILNSISEKVESQRTQLHDITKVSMRLENLHEIISEIKRLLSR